MVHFRLLNFKIQLNLDIVTCMFQIKISSCFCIENIKTGGGCHYINCTMLILLCEWYKSYLSYSQELALGKNRYKLHKIFLLSATVLVAHCKNASQVEFSLELYLAVNQPLVERSKSELLRVSVSSTYFVKTFHSCTTRIPITKVHVIR